MSSERLGRRLRQNRNMAPVTFVDNNNSSLSSFSEASSVGGRERSEQPASPTQWLGLRGKLFIVLVASVATAIAVYNKKKPEDKEDIEQATTARKWAVTSAGGVAGIMGYLLFFYNRK